MKIEEANALYKEANELIDRLNQLMSIAGSQGMVIDVTVSKAYSTPKIDVNFALNMKYIETNGPVAVE